MHELEEGDELGISTLRNRFPLAYGARRYLLFAGSGSITPILCMTEHLAIVGSS